MSITEPSFVSAGQIRRAARVLNRAADAGVTVDIEELRKELRRIGLGARPPKTPAASPAEVPERPRADDAADSSDVALPPPTGRPASEPIWVRPKTGASIADVGLTSFYRWLNTGRVVSRKVGGVTLVSVQSIRDIKADLVPTCRSGPRARKAIREEE
jgi:hypothetical protein